MAAMGGGDQALLGATSSEHALAAASSPGPLEGEASGQAVDAQPLCWVAVPVACAWFVPPRGQLGPASPSGCDGCPGVGDSCA